MRTLIAFLLVAFAAAAWWSTRGAEPVAPNARLQTAAANAKASPAPQAAVAGEPAYVAPRAMPAEAASPSTPAAAPLQFAVLAAVVIPGEKPVLTLLIGGDSVTV